MVLVTGFSKQVRYQVMFNPLAWIKKFFSDIYSKYFPDTYFSRNPAGVTCSFVHEYINLL